MARGFESLVSLVLWATAAASGPADPSSSSPLAAGDVCYRFCEVGSQPFLNRRADCPQDAPCASPNPPGFGSFDSCGRRAHVCGGGKASHPAVAKGEVASSDENSQAATAPKRPLLAARTQGEEQVRSLQQTIDCVADPDNLYCCELIEEQPCLMKDIVKASDGCSTACQRRYQTLGYECYEQFRTHFIFEQMMRNCDPTGVFEWKPPTTTQAPRDMTNDNTGPDTIGVASAAPRTTLGADPLSVVLSAGMALLASAVTL